MDTQQRPAQPGELCTCGRQAVTVYSNEQFGDAGHCGIDGAASTPVLPCPWCGTNEPHKESWGDPAKCPEYQLRVDEDVERKPWTVGQLRAELAKYPDDTPLRISVPTPDPLAFDDWGNVVLGAARGVDEYHDDGSITLTSYLLIESHPLADED